MATKNKTSKLSCKQDYSNAWPNGPLQMGWVFCADCTTQLFQKDSLVLRSTDGIADEKSCGWREGFFFLQSAEAGKVVNGALDVGRD